MALTNSGISDVERLVQDIQRYSSEFEEPINSFEYVMQNADFMKFAEDTKFGSDVQEKLKKLLQIIEGNLKSQISKNCAETNDFLAQQRSLNNLGL